MFSFINHRLVDGFEKWKDVTVDAKESTVDSNDACFYLLLIIAPRLQRDRRAFFPRDPPPKHYEL